MENLNPSPKSTILSEKHPLPTNAVNRVLVVLLIFATLTSIGLGLWGYLEHNRDRKPIPIVTEFEKAFESGKIEEVKAIFTEDGILTTASNTHSAFYRRELERGDVDSSEFYYLATLHDGEDFTIIGTPIMVGDNTVAFGWQWGSTISGTAILHLRDGKIVIAILNPSQYSIPLGGG